MSSVLYREAYKATKVEVDYETAAEIEDSITCFIPERSCYSQQLSTAGAASSTSSKLEPIHEAISEATGGRAACRYAFSHWQLVESDPLEAGTPANAVLVAERARRGLKDGVPTITDFCEQDKNILKTYLGEGKR